jgi:hypothetical protein
MLRDTYRRIKGALEPLRPVYDAWMKAIAAFSWLLARVLLTVLFFTAFIAYSVVLTVSGKDPMLRRLDESIDTYWRDNIVSNEDLDDFNKLY